MAKVLRLLARYTDRDGGLREVLARRGAAASVLVIDRDAYSRGDRRLVAHLDADEPRENARIVCAEYLSRVTGERLRCRALEPADLERGPNGSPYEPPCHQSPSLIVGGACHGSSVPRFRLRCIPPGEQLMQLRWWRCGPGWPARPVSVREAIATLESYEPVRTITTAALAPERQRCGVSTTVLRAELKRVLESPIVLNRGLREATLARIEHGELSMSEIAIRCGRTKRDLAGNESGETSWLGRRLGLLPEGGKSEPTPWIHSDVLALIARCGLGIAPREVEL
jgi:hypothetical protein